MSEMKEIKASEIKLGDVFSEPLFFDDGHYMFLPSRKAAKHYHIEAVKRWGLEVFLTEGRKLDEAERQAALSGASETAETSDKTNDNPPADIEELEGID